MREEYVRERKVREKTDKERREELVKSILSAKEELNQLNENFEHANEDMIDYYTYQLKANQSKLDYLIKFAKNKGISLDMIEAVKMKLCMQNDEVV
jgi:hypothetical protein